VGAIVRVAVGDGDGAAVGEGDRIMVGDGTSPGVARIEGATAGAPSTPHEHKNASKITIHRASIYAEGSPIGFG
jgi:hypothetical protein